MADSDPNNVVAFLIPVPELVEGIGYLGTQMMESSNLHGDIPNVLDLVPDNWDDTIVAHHYPIAEMIADMIDSGQFGLSPDPMAVYTAEAITHIAVLEGPVIPEGTKSWNFDGAQVKGVSMLVLWSEPRRTYRFIHCASCCRAYVAWLGYMQGEWLDAIGQQFQSDPNTRH